MSDRCKICSKMVDTKSDLQSEFANWLNVHQEPCLNVYLAAILARKYPEEGGETGLAYAMDDLLFDAEMRTMHDADLTLPYFNWQMALLSRLLRNKELFNELQEMEKKGRESETKTM